MKLHENIAKCKYNIQKISFLIRNNLLKDSSELNIAKIDKFPNNARVYYGMSELLFRGVRTSKQSGKHQPILWCYPRSLGRGDGSIYNRPMWLKTIVTVFVGFLNSPIAKAGIDSSIIHTFFGDQNSQPEATIYRSGLICFRNYLGGTNA